MSVVGLRSIADYFHVQNPLYATQIEWMTWQHQAFETFRNFVRKHRLVKTALAQTQTNIILISVYLLLFSFYFIFGHSKSCRNEDRIYQIELESSVKEIILQQIKYKSHVCFSFRFIYNVCITKFIFFQFSSSSFPHLPVHISLHCMEKVTYSTECHGNAFCVLLEHE